MERAAGNNTYSWNLAGELAGGTINGQTITYTYDGDDNRLTTSNNGTTTNELWDTNAALPQLALERDASNNLVRRYLFGLQTTSLTTPAGTSFYHYDPTGSVANITDSTGATQWTYGYEPFGNGLLTAKNSQGAPANTLGFADQYLDTSSNLYNMRARQYDAGIGSFLSPDPMTQPIALPYTATYVYAEDQPTELVDPSGMDSDSVKSTLEDAGRHVLIGASVGAGYGCSLGAVAASELGPPGWVGGCIVSAVPGAVIGAEAGLVSFLEPIVGPLPFP